MKSVEKGMKIAKVGQDEWKRPAGWKAAYVVTVSVTGGVSRGCTEFDGSSRGELPRDDRPEDLVCSLPVSC